MRQIPGGTFHSTNLWLEPGSVEVTVIGDCVSGPRTMVSREALEKVVFLYTLDGEARVRLSDAGEIRLRTNDILIVFPGRVLTVELKDRSNRLMSVALSGVGAVRGTLGLGYWDLMRANEPYEGNYMAEIIDQFHAAPARGRDARVLSMVEHLLSTVWSRIRYASGRSEFFDAVRTLNRFVCTGGSPTTEAAAAALGVSRSKLNSLFVGDLGIRPGEYISRVIGALAKGELFCTRKSVARIAAKFGFSSASAFAVFFRRRFGKSPAEFRRNPIKIV